ncbi:hypothetical protein ccbrp13_31100 [Ktedonobacteria bacterium brp13]|nr:hypothetical protein ccbrp13_31100 [Ktedonobacteria bacterium brp13]
MRQSPLPQQSEASQTFALSIIPPLQTQQEQIMLEAAMQSLVLDSQHPVALELSGSNEERRFIVRATTQTALDHIETLLRAQYPQLEVRPLRPFEDPFRLEPHESVSAVELVMGGAAYLPLRTWTERKGGQEEVDPILGLLAALSKLPYQTRAIAQLSLVPAPVDWSKNSLRKTVEHSLEPERRAQQAERSAAGTGVGAVTIGMPLLIALGVEAGLFLLLEPMLPAWVGNSLGSLINGQMPTLTSIQIITLILSIAGCVILFVVIAMLVDRIQHSLKPTPIYNMSMVEQKTSRVAYRTRLRLYVIGPQTHDIRVDLEQAQSTTFSRVLSSLPARWQWQREKQELKRKRKDVMLRLIATYRQYHLASGSYFTPRTLSAYSAERLLRANRHALRSGWARGLRHSQQYITVDALSALWHLPNASKLSELALVEYRKARTLLIPPEVSRLSESFVPIGYSEHAGHRLPFALIPEFFTVHTFIGGKSGEGKSTFMERVSAEAMTRGGLVLIDPHGDLCEHVLQLVPPSRVDDVVLIDLADKNASVGINPIDVTLGRSRDKAIADLLKTLSHIWSTSWGPRMENVFEMALRTLFEINSIMVAQDPEHGPSQQYTLMDVLPLLTNENFCRSMLQQIDDDYLHRWWREYYEPLSLMQQRDIINPVITKVTKFESVIARRIIGQGRSTINFTEMIAERKIILINLAKGIVGADVAGIIGATLLGLIQITLEEQGVKAAEERARFPIIIDEFQVMAGVDYGALAELRKYGATFFLATQSLEYLQKLDDFLLPTVMANVKQLIIFHMSAQDADTVHRELGVEPEDILNIDMHTCYVKMPAGDHRQPTFSMRVIPATMGDKLLAESIRTRCRIRYTTPVETIDGMLRDAMVRSIRMAPSSQKKAGKKGGRPSNSNTPRPHSTRINSAAEDPIPPIFDLEQEQPEVVLLDAPSDFTLLDSSHIDNNTVESSGEPTDIQSSDVPIAASNDVNDVNDANANTPTDAPAKKKKNRGKRALNRSLERAARHREALQKQAELEQATQDGTYTEQSATDQADEEEHELVELHAYSDPHENG